MGVQLQRNSEDFFQSGDQRKGVIRRDQTGHILDRNTVGAHLLQDFCFVDIIFEVKDRPAHFTFGQRVTDGQLRVFTCFLNGFEAGFHVTFIIQGIENTEDIDADFGRMFDESFNHIIGIMTVPTRFWPRSSICRGVLGISFFRTRGLSQGSSFRKRVATSKVAPPQTSIEWKPILSISGAIAAISAVVIRVAKIDWWPSRNVTSVILTGFLPVEFIMALPVDCRFIAYTNESILNLKLRMVRSLNLSI